MSRFIVGVLACVVSAVCVGGLGGCQSEKAARTDADSRPQIFEGLGSHHRVVTTNSREAQRYFDQGLTWAYAFNHDEAIRSFEEAARLDPSCAMAWWGVALCHGPHINNPVMSEVRSRAAWDAIRGLAPRRGRRRSSAS